MGGLLVRHARRRLVVVAPATTNRTHRIARWFFGSGRAGGSGVVPEENEFHDYWEEDPCSTLSGVSAALIHEAS